MCGLAGYVAPRVDPDTLRQMVMPIIHRGPDDEGLWIDEEAGIALGHRRLSIIDLSPAGHQPMVSANGRFVIVYNGEIYNHVALRTEVEAAGGTPEHGWRGHSDTETLLASIALWGLEASLKKCIGMFAIALWDRQQRRLSLARDRFGEKPLYYGWTGRGDFLFGSELKALRAHPGFDNEIDRRALRIFASRTYIPAPFSIFRRIYKLEPASILTAGLEALRTPANEAPTSGTSSQGITLTHYWSYREVVEAGLANPIRHEAEALERIEQAVVDAIKGQSVADVPVGAFLSGGIDSSTVVALYQKHSPRSVRTFSIGFEESGYDEAPFAKAVARHFGTDHNERYVTAREALEVIPQLPAIYDEPFADSSQIPTHLVSRFAREQVTVALSGDGGDELFGGYNRYVTAARAWGKVAQVPAPLRTAAGGILGALPPAFWNSLFRLAPGHRRPAHLGVKIQKGLRTMTRANAIEDIFPAFLDEWWGGPSPVIGANAEAGIGPMDFSLGRHAPHAVRMMYTDAVSYLPDDILCKVDRAAMAVSLETRVPLLDHRLAEVAARIPVGMKIQGGKGKMILRKLLYKHAPPALFERPKAGFGIPLGDWLRGPLRPWVEDLLGRIDEDGYFDASTVRERWRQHLAGDRDGSHALWAVLMFQAWRAAGHVRSELTPA